jgi:4-amino-4-deoxy-L-arabinose transferase-like glycosyltransferase
MEAMYKTGLNIHYFGVVVLMGVVLFNMMMLALSHHVIRYAKRMRIVMPISSSFIALILFTGAVMMAAKHLSFTLANVAMIVIAIIMIILEAKRYKTLKRKTDITQEGAFAEYKKKAFRFLGIEMSLLLVMSIWMMVQQ